MTSVSDARAEFVLVTWSLMRRTAHLLTEDGQNVHNGAPPGIWIKRSRTAAVLQDEAYDFLSALASAAGPHD